MLLPEIQGRISLSNVSAGPPGADKPVLKQVSLDISSGDVVGVIGPSAGGKTTLAKVVIGVWPARIGEVRIDGADVRALPRDVLGPQLGYLPQQVDLLAGTVQENIARFSDDADANAVIAAAKEASCHELILELPNGYDTEIGAGGAYLSAGQRQRIGLARALFGNPKLIVLDEPNSNLDGPGDEALNMAIANLKKRGATTLIIAHRPNAIVHCNKVVVLDKGQVKAFGPRDEILASLTQTWSQKNTITPIRQGGSVAEQGS
ncbi:MAG: ATP-binding cassette domain-containing protein [Pseudomonadota bacterium]